MAYGFGSGVQAQLGATDYSNYLRGALIGAQMQGAGGAAIGQGIASGLGSIGGGFQKLGQYAGEGAERLRAETKENNRMRGMVSQARKIAGVLAPGIKDGRTSQYLNDFEQTVTDPNVSLAEQAAAAELFLNSANTVINAGLRAQQTNLEDTTKRLVNDAVSSGMFSGGAVEPGAPRPEMDFQGLQAHVVSQGGDPDTAARLIEGIKKFKANFNPSLIQLTGADGRIITLARTAENAYTLIPDKDRGNAGIEEAEFFLDQANKMLQALKSGDVDSALAYGISLKLRDSVGSPVNRNSIVADYGPAVESGNKTKDNVNNGNVPLNVKVVNKIDGSTAGAPPPAPPNPVQRQSAAPAVPTQGEPNYSITVPGLPSYPQQGQGLFNVPAGFPGSEASPVATPAMAPRSYGGAPLEQIEQLGFYEPPTYLSNQGAPVAAPTPSVSNQPPAGAVPQSVVEALTKTESGPTTVMDAVAKYAPYLKYGPLAYYADQAIRRESQGLSTFPQKQTITKTTSQLPSGGTRTTYGTGSRIQPGTATGIGLAAIIPVLDSILGSKYKESVNKERAIRGMEPLEESSMIGFMVNAIIENAKDPSSKKGIKKEILFEISKISKSKEMSIDERASQISVLNELLATVDDTRNIRPGDPLYPFLQSYKTTY